MYKGLRDGIEELKAVETVKEYETFLQRLIEKLRKEVAEDSGVGTVRSDMWIPTLQAVIETKCTRKSMTIKKLTEELEADIIHYRAKTLYFYIFDKEKLVLDRSGFERYFNWEFDGKEVKIFLLQPVKM